MAGILRVTNGTDTVDFLDSTILHLLGDGYNPLVAYQDGAGHWVDLIETLRCWWAETDDDDRAATMQKLMRLAEQARRYDRERRVDAPVWVEASLHNETNTRYALIRDITIPALATQHWSFEQGVDLNIVITREGPWRGVAPNGTPIEVSSLSDLVQNRDDGEGVNYVITDALTDIPGDVPALARFELKGELGTELTDLFRLSMMTADTLAELNSVSTHFNAGDAGGGAPSTTADTSAPDDVRLDYSGATSTDDVYEWSLPSSIGHYAGSYLVFAVAQATGGNTVEMAFYREGVEGDYVTVSAGPSYSEHYLGRFDIPSRRITPGVSLPSSYDISLLFRFTSLGTFRFWNMFIVPVREGFFNVVADAGSQRILLDGDLEIATQLNHTTGGILMTSAPPIVYGSYFTIPPNKFVRIDYFASQGGNVNADQFFDLTTTIVPRYSSLRGAS